MDDRRTPLCIRTTDIPRTLDDGDERWWIRPVVVGDADGDDRPRPLTARQTPVGREPGNDGLRLRDDLASRLHATLERPPGGSRLVVADADSTNGTWLNGRRVDRASLAPGDVLRVGASVLLVGRGEADQEPEDLGLIGRTPAARALRTLIRRVAPSELPALVIGPTGTGKELVAHALHARSARTGELVVVNCAALPATLVESALFGRRRGAYTHATSDEPGAFGQAHGGTLFLDEIGELPLEAQPKLLRALESGEITAVGASRASRVDVRVVAATNRPLLDEVRGGTFREDLYARLAGIVIETPPLAQRRDDLVPLFRALLPAANRATPLTADFAEALLLYGWPRNVRELRQLASRLPVLHPDAARWTLDMLDPDIQAARTGDGDTPGPTWPPTREGLLDLLARCDGNVSQVAALVGRNRKQVYRWMETHGITPGAGR